MPGPPRWSPERGLRRRPIGLRARGRRRRRQFYGLRTAQRTKGAPVRGLFGALIGRAGFCRGARRGARQVGNRRFGGASGSCSRPRLPAFKGACLFRRGGGRPRRGRFRPRLCSLHPPGSRPGRITPGSATSRQPRLHASRRRGDHRLPSPTSFGDLRKSRFFPALSAAWPPSPVPERTGTGQSAVGSSAPWRHSAVTRQTALQRPARAHVAAGYIARCSCQWSGRRQNKYESAPAKRDSVSRQKRVDCWREACAAGRVDRPRTRVRPAASCGLTSRASIPPEKGRCEGRFASR